MNNNQLKTHQNSDSRVVICFFQVIGDRFKLKGSPEAQTLIFPPIHAAESYWLFAYTLSVSVTADGKGHGPEAKN